MRAHIFNHKKSWVIGISIVSILLATLFIFYNKGQKSLTTQFKGLPPPKYQYNVEKTLVPLYASAMGNVVPDVSSVISAEIPGQIRKVYVHEGQEIGVNEILADIEDKTYLTELNRIEQETESLKAQLDQRKNLFERIDRLVKKEAATAIEWEKAKSDYLSTLAQFDASNEQVKALVIRYNKTKIISPYKGIVGKKLIAEGDYVSPGSALFQIYSIGPMDVEFFVPERYMTHIHVDDQVSVSIELSQVNTTATISKIIPYEDTKSRTFRVKARLNNYNSNLAGAFVRVQFTVGEHISIFIPMLAVERIGQLEMVKIFDNGVWNRRYIRTGDQVDEKIEVLSGLDGGEVIGYD